MRVKENADVTFVCGGQTFYAHKCILAAASPYFKMMFSCGLEESKSGAITFNTMEPETLEAILNFIYTGKVEHITSAALLKSVLVASHLIQLDALVQYCGKSLVLVLSLNNFFDFLDVGIKYEQEDFRISFINFWVINSSKLIDTDKFLALGILEIKELLNFVKSKCQCLDDILKGFLNWLRYDFKSCEIFIDEFFDCVDAKLVKQRLVQSLLNDKEVLGLSKKVNSCISKLSVAIVKSGYEPPPEMMLLDVCSWKTKLTYFSQKHHVYVFDPTVRKYTVPRTESLNCVQQFDLSSMTWLQLQIPELTNLSEFKDMYQYGDIIYMISETHVGSYEVSSNRFRIEKCKNNSPPGDGFAVFNRHLYTTFCKRVFYSDLEKYEWKKASRLTVSVSGAVLLASSECLYIIGDNPASTNEFIIQYNSNPSVEFSNWGVIHIVKGGLISTDFFVYRNALSALIEFGYKYCQGKYHANTYNSVSNLNLLTYDPTVKKIVVDTHQIQKGGVLHTSLKLSRFQDYRSPYIFFTDGNDNFSIPSYAWQPETGMCTKLPDRKGKCDIPNDPSVKLVYSVDI